MRFFLFNLSLGFVFIFFSCGLSAKSIQCASPSGESLYFQSTKSEVSLSYGNGRGSAFTPLEDGPVRAVSFGFYQMAYADMKEILEGFLLKWPISSCSIKSDFWLSSCLQAGQLASDPGHKSNIRVNGVNLSKLTDSGASGEQISYRFRIIFEKEGNSYFIPLVFPKDLCQVTTD